MKSGAMMRRALLLAVLIATLPLPGCLNPFAPQLGDVAGELWDPQTSIGGLLRNFRTSYNLRDSLRYADLIADEFVFQYFNVDQQRFDEWYRDTELRATGGLMRSTDHLDLRWGPWVTELDTFSQPDTTVEFTITFSLSVGQQISLSGFARFRARTGSDGRFRLVLWRDDY